MAYATKDTIAEKVLSSFDGTESPRLAEILTKLTEHLHAFTREVGLTREKWAFGLEDLDRRDGFPTSIWARFT